MRWKILAGAAVLVTAGVAAAVVQPSAQAATTIRVDSLTPYQLIKPGPVTVSGRTTGSPAGETVRILLNNDLKVTVPVVDGRFSGTFDTGALGDGVYTIYADVPDGNGYQFSAGTPVYVDEVPGDIVVTSPKAGSTITSFTEEGLIVAGRVADPELVPQVSPMIGEQGMRGISAPVAEDGTFRLVVPAQDVAQGPVRVAVYPNSCLDWTVCGALGTSAVTIKASPYAVITAPTANQLFEFGTSRISLGLEVTNPGPADEVSATIDGKLPVNMASPMRRTATQSLYWTSVFVTSEVGEGRHTLRMSAKIRGVAVPIPDRVFVVDFSPPSVPAVTAPATVLAASAPVNWPATDDGGIDNYDVRWRTTSAIQPTSGYGYPSSLQRVKAPRATIALAAGKSYCFSARARDVAAKTSDWSPEKCTLTPFDDRWLTVSKNTKRISWPGFVANTATTMPAKGTASRPGVTATQVGVVVRACPTCGPLTVAHAGTKLGTISLKASIPTRVVLWLPVTKQRTGTLTLTAPNGATLDGVFLRR
ncbi:hypothetical protein JIG36_50720 [Actinoplanes sp. LDG1-06]|uniref:Fibronectin type-III domain-containing protein n=1 Tax=Paractinoplanes ovalisporus TaxID=2810368 RepID=A0ABS2AV90_9ACTN|nr:hypothetical protein [Actinoplanes ovalisporus]MBM2623792.1 hypothetical protein [Actinoplanes ovalisporus]